MQQHGEFGRDGGVEGREAAHALGVGPGPAGDETGRGQLRGAGQQRDRAASIRAATPLAASIRCRWPSSPNPVTSVAARTPAARAARLAPALSRVIEATAAWTTSAAARRA